MSDLQQKRTLGAADLDTLVATYAPIGVMRLRARQRRRASLVVGCVALVAAAATVSYSYHSIMSGMTKLVAHEATAVDSRRLEDLDADRAAVLARLAEIEQQLAAVQQHKTDLATQQVEIREQSARLALLLDELDTGQQELAIDPGHAARLDDEIRAMAAQRDALEKRWEHFEAQGELLAMEIMAVNMQRKELETQRRQIDQQQRELANLLDRAEGLYRRAAGAISNEPVPDTTSTRADTDEYTYTYNSLVADANELIADNGQLDQMRGGFSIGDGLDISFGFTQTGAINGIEQYTNHFSIDSLGSGLGNVDMSNMNSVVIQNGSGNFVGPAVLDSLANSFGSIIQNTLDDQVISTTTVYDISLHNVPGALQGLSGEQAMFDSLGSYR